MQTLQTIMSIESGVFSFSVSSREAQSLIVYYFKLRQDGHSGSSLKQQYDTARAKLQTPSPDYNSLTRHLKQAQKNKLSVDWNRDPPVLLRGGRAFPPFEDIPSLLHVTYDGMLQDYETNIKEGQLGIRAPSKRSLLNYFFELYPIRSSVLRDLIYGIKDSNESATQRSTSIQRALLPAARDADSETFAAGGSSVGETANSSSGSTDFEAATDGVSLAVSGGSVGEMVKSSCCSTDFEPATDDVSFAVGGGSVAEMVNSSSGSTGSTTDPLGN